MPAFSEDQINEAKERVRRMHARAGSYLPREEPPQGHNDRQTAPPPGKEKASPAAPNPEEHGKGGGFERISGNRAGNSYS